MLKKIIVCTLLFSITHASQVPQAPQNIKESGETTKAADEKKQSSVAPTLAPAQAAAAAQAIAVKKKHKPKKQLKPSRFTPSVIVPRC